MAHPQAAALLAQEIKIRIEQDAWVQYSGTMAQLQAEGLIPAHFEQPLPRQNKCWTQGAFSYWLKPTRPEGPSSQHNAGHPQDHWTLLVTVPAHDHQWHVRRAFDLEHKALNDRYWGNPAKAQAQAQRWAQAVSDPRFCAFKASLLPQCGKARNATGASK